MLQKQDTLLLQKVLMSQRMSILVETLKLDHNLFSPLLFGIRLQKYLAHIFDDFKNVELNMHLCFINRMKKKMGMNARFQHLMTKDFGGNFHHYHTFFRTCIWRKTLSVSQSALEHFRSGKMLPKELNF